MSSLGASFLYALALIYPLNSVALPVASYETRSPEAIIEFDITQRELPTLVSFIKDFGRRHNLDSVNTGSRMYWRDQDATLFWFLENKGKYRILVTNLFRKRETEIFVAIYDRERNGSEDWRIIWELLVNDLRDIWPDRLPPKQT